MLRMEMLNEAGDVCGWDVVGDTEIVESEGVCMLLDAALEACVREWRMKGRREGLGKTQEA